MNRLIVPLAVAVAMLACSKRGNPSPSYTQAQELFQRVYAEKLDEAFDDDRMPKVEQLLANVPATSSDAPAARQLSERILTGRAHQREETKKRKENLAAAREPVTLPPSQYVRPNVEVAAGTPPPAVDAGPPRNPSPGMPYDQFVDLFSGCFRQRGSIMVEGHGMKETWELKDITNCRDRHPGFDELIVLIDENKILATVRKDAIQKVAADGGAR